MKKRTPARRRATKKSSGVTKQRTRSRKAGVISTGLPIRNILVPIDFSEYSKNALRYAIPMAEQYGATLHLVYVIEPTIYPADLGFGQVVVPGVEEELRSKSKAQLENLIATEIGSRVRTEAVVRTGKPHQEILREAKEKDIDLIIVATHGHTGVEQMLFGSTAMRIVRLATCPVLTVRPHMNQ
jgi:nucleotide-binding universal stress UspA family protein